MNVTNKVGFFLKRPKEQKRQALVALFRLNGELVKIYTDISIHPNQWSKPKQRLNSKHPDYVQLNARLDRMAADIRSILIELSSQHIVPSPQLVRQKYESLLVRDATRTGKTVLEYWDDWLQATENTKQAETRKGYRSKKNHIQEFSKARGKNLTFDGMDRHFVNSLTDYLVNVRQVTNATIWNTLKAWKAFMKWAVQQGLTTNRYYEEVKRKDFNVQEPEMIRLTEEELKRIAALDLTKDSRLDNARNLFVLACCLGVRFGDLQAIVASPTDYIKEDTIRLTTGKNKKKVSIPLIPIAKQFLHEGKQLRVISNQNFNAYIKEVAKRAGLTESVIRTLFRGSTRTDTAYPKYELVAAHTAKRTFYSLMIARNVTAETLMKVTGNTRSTIDRYIYLDEQDIQQDMKKAADLLTA